MNEREKAVRLLRSLSAEDLIPMLGLDQAEPGYTVYDAYRPGRTAKPRRGGSVPNYAGSAMR